MNNASKFAMPKPKPQSVIKKQSNQYEPIDWKNYFTNQVMVEDVLL